MAIEARPRSSGRYYYRKVWRGGRCRSVYLGKGEVADLCAAVAEAERGERRAQKPAEDPAPVPFVAQVEAYCESVTAIMRAHLEANGYRRHKRGEWRKQRG